MTLPPHPVSPAELAALAREVRGICRRAFEPPQVLSCKGMTTLLFAEKPALRAVFGAAGVAARGTISGDAVQQFCSPAAAQMILCDGMGNGRPAAVDGNLAAELTARLLKAGFTAELAARLVNVALALKSDEESGATLDLISVDLYTGTARLFKAGAAPGSSCMGAGPGRGRCEPADGHSGRVNGQSRMVHLAAGITRCWCRTACWWTAPAGMQQLELSAAKAEQPDVLAKNAGGSRPRPSASSGPSLTTLPPLSSGSKTAELILGGERVYLSVSGSIIGGTYMLTVTVAAGWQRRLRVHRGGGAGRTL